MAKKISDKQVLNKIAKADKKRLESKELAASIVAPAVAPIASEMVEKGVIKYASFDRRLIAFTIDIILLVLLSIPLNWVLEKILFGNVPANEIISGVLEQNQPDIAKFGLTHVLIREGVFYKIITLQLASVVLLWTYCVFSWTYMQATIGKQFMRISIVVEEGKTMNFWRANLRFFSYIVSALGLCIGFFWIYFNHKRRAWHDYLASTYVVHKEEKI